MLRHPDRCRRPGRVAVFHPGRCAVARSVCCALASGGYVDSAGAARMTEGPTRGCGMENGKIRCTGCGWTGTEALTDKVKDPRGHDVWDVCPACRLPENFVSLCDEPGCQREITCGTPTPDGYRQTCHVHHPKAAVSSQHMR